MTIRLEFLWSSFISKDKKKKTETTYASVIKGKQ